MFYFKLRRSGVISLEKNNPVIYSHLRISKFAWLADTVHKYVENISKRVADMSGLSMRTAELLQVVNYGLGGYYTLHYDFALPGDKTFEKINLGNRIATVLFYVNVRFRWQCHIVCTS